MSDKWAFVRENDGEYTIGKNGHFYNDLVISGVDNTIHAIQWNGTSGELERRDTSTGRITANETFSSLSSYSFVESNWNTARASHKATWTAQYILDQAGEGNVVSQEDADTAFEAAFPA